MTKSAFAIKSKLVGFLLSFVPFAVRKRLLAGFSLTFWALILDIELLFFSWSTLSGKLYVVTLAVSDVAEFGHRARV